MKSRFPNPSIVKIQLPPIYTVPSRKAVLRLNEITEPLGLTLKPTITLQPSKIIFTEFQRNEVPIWAETQRHWAGYPTLSHCVIRMKSSRPWTDQYVWNVLLHELEHFIGMDHNDAKPAMINTKGPADQVDYLPRDIQLIRKHLK